jgi:two-component system sensor histidine kinase/response regulator
MNNTSPRRVVLVVEDDEAVRQTVADMLELNDYECVQAIDGSEGLALARLHRPSVIMSDIEMPRVNGFELLRQIRADQDLRTIPVIMVTAKVDRTASRQGMDLGADDYITKPFTEDELIHSIEARLEKKELLDELDAFGHTVAHDLKNPLAALLGRIGLVELMIGSANPAALRENLAEASAAAQRLGRIIDELLLLAGVRRDRVTAGPLNMGALVAEARERNSELLKQRGATLVIADELPAAVGYGPWVTHIWTNYISNAATYGGPAAQISVGGEIRPDGRTARFWVADRGAGLDAAAQNRLFVPFTRISTVRAKGHGLGLSIVRRIVEKLGGQVGVESQPGQGARFWFELPRSVPVPAT